MLASRPLVNVRAESAWQITVTVFMADSIGLYWFIQEFIPDKMKIL